VFIERGTPPPTGDEAKDKAAAEAAARSPQFDDANIRRSIPELREGRTPNFKRLAVQTAMANDAAAKQVSVALKESDQPDQIDATVRVREQRPWWVSISASNTGSPSSGNDRLTLSAAHSNLLNRDHQAVLSLTTSGEKTKDVQQYGLNYRVPLYGLGGVLGVSATKSNVIGNFGTFSSTGAGGTWGLNYTHHLPAEGGHRGYVSMSFDNKRFDVAQINGIPFPGQMMRRSQPFTVGYSARNESDARNIAYSLDLASNFAGSSGNDLASYQSEDPRLSTVRWHVLRMSFNYLTPVFERKWLLAFKSQMQYTPHALMSGEQFGIGGSSSVRGTSERPISGDKGVSFSTELTSPELWTGMRAHGFIDGGYLTNVVSNGATKLDNDRLASVGLGLRYGHPMGLAISAEYGRIVTGSKVLTSINNASPQRGDEKIHLNASFRF
jgi:hemolysin activation/secretion protein